MTRSRSFVPILVLGAVLGAVLGGCDDDAGRSAGEPDARSSADSVAAAPTDSAATAAAASSGSPSTPDHAAYARLRATVCDTMTNSFDCARAIEGRQLEDAEDAWRHGDTLRLALATGDTARFVDQPGGQARSEYYSYQDAWPDAGLILLQKQYYEGSEYLLVDDSTGSRTRLPDWPLRSPDGRHFAVLSLDLVAGYGPNTLQVWAMGEEGGEPERVWETEPSQWGPRSGSWQDRETLGFIQHGYCGELGGEGRRMCDRPATLTRRGGSWHLDTGTVRDAR